MSIKSIHPLTVDLDHVLTHTRDLWEELRGQRIFITGGTGFFGCWLLEGFAWANDRLALNSTAVVLTRDVAKFRKKSPGLAAHPSISFLTGDVRSFTFPTGTFSHVIHAATDAIIPANAAESLAMIETIEHGTRHVLDFAVACGARKILLTSSGAVYGRQPSELTHIPEDFSGAPDMLQPGSAYGEGKRMAEMLGTLYQQKHPALEVKIGRCFAFVGPYLPLDQHYAVGNFIRDALAGGPIFVQGDGTPYRSYLYAADLAIWLWTILFRGRRGRVYNIGSDEAIDIASLARSVGQSLGGDIKVVIGVESAKGKPVQRYVPAIERARQELQLAVWTPLAVALRKTVDHYKNQNS